MASGRFPGLWENPEIHKHLVTPSRGPVMLATLVQQVLQAWDPPQPGLPLPLRPLRKDRSSEKRGKGGNSGQPRRPDQFLPGNETLGRPARISGWSPGH